jgi:hypothetical protein
MPETILTAALSYLASGLSVGPIPPNAKYPVEQGWKAYQSRLPTSDELTSWFNGHTPMGLCIFCGNVSGGLEVLDFDEVDTYHEFVRLVRELGYDALLQRLLIEHSPRPGVHLAYLCDEIDHNTKLARVKIGVLSTGKDHVKTLIETRGEGGLIIVAPTPAGIHPEIKERGYELIQGDWTKLPRITTEARRILWNCARALNRYDDTAPRHFGEPQSDQDRVGSDYNAKISQDEVQALLEGEGWSCTLNRGEARYLLRPGKSGRAWSATLGVVAQKRLYVFSSNAHPFDNDRSYDPFGVYMRLKHGGDAKAAAKALAAMGYGRNGQPPDDDEEHYEERKTPPNPDVPWINAANQHLPVIAAEAWNALLASNTPPTLFAKGGLVRLEYDTDAAMVTKDLTRERLRYQLARIANFYVPLEDRRKMVLPPMWLVDDMLATPEPQLPVLTRITETPVFAPDGTLILTPGYHEAARIFYEPAANLHIPHVPLKPSLDDLLRAHQVLNEVLRDFTFVDDADKSHAYALFLLPFVRDLIQGCTPNHLIESPVPGSGKGLLADVLLRPSVGQHMGILTEAKDEDEWRKRLTSRFKEGRSVLLLDNIRRTMDSGQLAAALTANYWQDRILGTNETANIPVRNIWVTTGNNPVMSTEIARRTVRIRIDPKQDRPWLRNNFTHPDLRAYVDEHRSDLIWAGLVFVQYWISEGKPSEAKPRLGSYEQWSGVIGGILKSVRIPGFLANLDTFYEMADHEGAVLREFVSLWWKEHKSGEVTAKDLVPLALTIDGLDVRGDNEQSQRKSLGRLIAKQRGRVIDQYRIELSKIEQHVKRWKLLPTQVS